MSESSNAGSPSGWFVATNSGKKGPFDTPTMEGFIQNRKLTENSLVSHSQYTKGRAIEARKIARFFNLFANIKERQKGDSPEPGNRQVSGVIPSRSQPSPTNQLIPASQQQVIPTSNGIFPANDGNSKHVAPGHGILPYDSDQKVSGIERFMADGQDPNMVIKLLERVQSICTQHESALYMAVQQKPVMNFAPDAIVLTSRRAIIFRQKILGRLEFVDLLWLNVGNVHIREDILGATVSIQGTNGYVDAVSHLPKPQARMVYRIAQDMEEQMIEARRQRAMEETRAGAMNITVNNAQPQPVQGPASSGEDPLRSLQSLHGMYQAGLISQQEFETKKQQIMDRM